MKPQRDDVHDFMASVLGGQRRAVPRQKPRTLAPSPAPRPTLSPTPQPVRQHETTRPKDVRSPAKVRKTRKLVWAGGLAATLSLLLVGGALVWRGPLSALLEPKSPFSQETAEKMSVPLYYPTKLPGTFKMELGSITQPEADVVVYTVSDDTGKKFNISLQKQPEGINLDPLYEVLDDMHDIQTSLGTIKVGTSAEGAVIANILTGPTWIILNGEPSVMTDTLLTEVINGLKT